MCLAVLPPLLPLVHGCRGRGVPVCAVESTNGHRPAPLRPFNVRLQIINKA